MNATTIFSRVTRGVLAAGLLLATASARGEEADSGERLPDGARVVQLESFPDRIELTNPFDYRQVVLTAELADGSRVDATRIASLESHVDCVAVSSRRLVRPRSDGQSTLEFALQGKSVAIPVTVTRQTEPYHVSYVTDVQPALSKMGCNAGTCHGAAQGKNGFKLSLRGYDPLFDHAAFTDELASRRINRAAPDQSLMLLKPSGAAPHVGGVLTQSGEPYYEIIRRWIADGVSLDLDAPRVTSIEVIPSNVLIPLPGMKQQMAVIATYSDGRKRDVTAEAHIDSNLAERVAVDSQGLATAVRRGEAALLARYEGAYASTTVVVMGDRTGYAWTDVPVNNYIDELVYAKLQEVKILPSELCDDYQFIRRLYLDLTGLPPEPEEVRAFVADGRDTKVKRDELIDQLVGSPEFVEQWTNKWADLLQVNRKFLGEQGTWAFHNWIRQSLAANKPYDQFAREILTASGSTIENPPASYYKVLRDPGETMENTTQLFLAIRFNCNKCHDHPFERWTQDQYYHMAAYFAQVGRKESPDFAGKKLAGRAVEQALAAVEVIYDQGRGEVEHIRTGEVASPEFPYEVPGESATEGSRRQQLSDWICSPKNPYFATSYVNRIWSYLLGVGIIEPVDDIRAGNPPSNPELLDRLTQEFIASGFDTQHMFRDMCKSRVYQHSIATNQWNADDDINYSHAIARRLPAETLYDAIQRTTGADNRLPGVPVGFRASQLPDSAIKLADGFLDLFGKPPRESACECERSTGVMLGQALNMVNGPTIADAIVAPNNRIEQLVAENSDDRKVIEELYMAILCRKPTPEEVEAALEVGSAARVELEENRAALAAYERDALPMRLAEWETNNRPAEWQVLEPVEMRSAGGATFMRQNDGSILLGGTRPDKDVYTLKAQTGMAGITGVRLEVLTDASLPGNGPGRAANGNFVLNDFKVTAADAEGKNFQDVKIEDAVADFAQDRLAVVGAVDTNAKSGWAISPQLGKPHTALFTTAENIGSAGGTTLTFTLSQQFGSQHAIGRFRLSVTDSPRPLRLLADLPDAIAKILLVPKSERSPQQQKQIAEHFRGVDEEWQRLKARTLADHGGSDSYRLVAAQDLAWALINSPAFLFNW